MKLFIKVYDGSGPQNYVRFFTKNEHMINFAKYNCHSWYHETVMEQETLSHVKIHHFI